MAATIAIKEIKLIDDRGVGPVRALVEAQVSTDDPAAVALGLADREDRRWAYLPRADFDALIAALRRPSDKTAALAGVAVGDDWPDDAAPHPVAKDP